MKKKGEKSAKKKTNYLVIVPDTITINPLFGGITLGKFGVVSVERKYTIKYIYRKGNLKAGIPFSAFTYNYDPANPGNNIEVYTYYDGLGRIVQTKKDASTDEMMIVSGRAYYDAFGRTVKSYYPVTETKDVQYSTGLDDIAPSTTTYDILDRPLIQKAPDNTTTAYSYDFGTDDRNQTMFLTEITDPNTNTSQILKNVDGLQYMLQASGQAPVYFDYSLTGECIQVYGDDFSRSYAYDCLGRKTQYVEDSLKEIYTYSGVNLIEKKIYWNEQGETQHKTIDYTYSFNRLIAMQSFEYQDAIQYTYNNKGKLDTIKDASGKQIFKYGSMGEVTSQTRIYTLPFMEQSVKIENKFEYDSWGRINKLTYPDGEVVKYEYDHGGLLKRITGSKNNNTYTYLNSIEYDKFGAKTKEQYGNGLFIGYSYNAQNLRLTTQETYRLIYGDQYQWYMTPVKQSYVNTSYSYDAIGNITQMNTTYSRTYPQTFNQTFSYDDANQLTQASGNTDSIYNLNINYGNYGRINTYNTSLTDPQTNIVQQQDNNFTYPTVDIPSTAFAPKANNDSVLYRYGINGSLRSKGNEYYLFNAFDQMKVYSDNGESYGYYGYDDKGERIYKLQLNTVSSNTNIYPNVKYLEVEKLMLYPNGYININPNGEYTKHYYADATRIASKIGGGFNASLSDTTTQNGDVLTTMKRELGEVVIPPDTVDGIEYSFGQITHLQGNSGQIEDGLFFYHANHLGSTQMVTDINADITQQVLYAPFGEVITEYNAYWHQEKIPDYMFNAKELDEENGMYYYEARYYAPPTFISRDPLFEEKPWISCYSYCSNNPTNRIDPDGRDDYGLDVNTGRLSLIKRTEDKMDRILLGTFGNKDDFTNNENNQIHVLSKGLLTVNNTSEDLSKTGISVSGGKQEEGIDLMKFISFNSNKELNAWGYDNNKGEAALEIAPWNENTATKSYLDNYNKSGAFDQMGTRTFKIHTHPGTKDGLGGYGYASDKDAANVQFSVPHYIMSRNHGITEYDKNNTTTPSKSMLPNSLRKHSLSK